MSSYRFWNVTKHYIVWNGAGAPAAWQGNPDHGYDVEVRQLRTPEARERWIEQIAEKTWASDAAKAEFARIVASITT
jgi:hypothetical protein